MQLFLSVLFCKDCSYWVLNFSSWLFSSIVGWLGCICCPERQDFYGWSTLKEVFSVFINVFGFWTFKVFRFADVCTHRKVHEHLFGLIKSIHFRFRIQDSWRNLLFVNLAFKAQPVNMLLPSPSAFWLFLRLIYSKRKPVYKLCKQLWVCWKRVFVCFFIAGSHKRW